MARPKKSILKQKTLTVHCTNMDYILIRNSAMTCKLSMSEYLLKTGLGVKVEAKLSTEEIKLFRDLTGMANNLNQVAKRLNNGETLKLKSIADLEKISDLINKFT